MDYNYLSAFEFALVLAAFLFGFTRMFAAKISVLDALIAAVLSCALSFIPSIGAGISVIGILLVVYWRAADISIGAMLFVSLSARICASAIVYHKVLV